MYFDYANLQEFKNTLKLEEHDLLSLKIWHLISSTWVRVRFELCVLRQCTNFILLILNNITTTNNCLLICKKLKVEGKMTTNLRMPNNLTTIKMNTQIKTSHSGNSLTNRKNDEDVRVFLVDSWQPRNQSLTVETVPMFSGLHYDWTMQLTCVPSHKTLRSLSINQIV